MCLDDCIWSESGADKSHAEIIMILIDFVGDFCVLVAEIDERFFAFLEFDPGGCS